MAGDYDDLVGYLVDDVLSKGNFDMVGKIVEPDVSVKWGSSNRYGMQAFTELVERYQSAVPQIQFQVTRMITLPNRVRLTWAAVVSDPQRLADRDLPASGTMDLRIGTSHRFTSMSILPGKSPPSDDPNKRPKTPGKSRAQRRNPA